MVISERFLNSGPVYPYNILMHQLRPLQTCLFCKGDLGSNALIEHCPVGRRLAFDETLGRLWVVCLQCGGWNLTPLDERWEAIEACERLFRSTSVRVSTENVSLAVVYGFLDLIRIGTPLRQELAIWRYADELLGRRRRAIFKVSARAADQYGWLIGAGGLLGAGVGLLFGAPVAVGVGMAAGAGTEEIWRGLGPDKIERLLGRIVAKVQINTLDFSFVRSGHVPELRLGHTRDHDWRVELPHSVGWEGYAGSHGTNVLGLMLPIANGFGATRGQVTDAVDELEAVGDAEAYFEHACKEIKRLGLNRRGVREYPMPVRLALEIAAHEETERQALRGELKWLERRWRDAEEVAEIADNLFVTSETEPIGERLPV